MSMNPGEIYMADLGETAPHLQGERYRPATWAMPEETTRAICTRHVQAIRCGSFASRDGSFC